MAEINSVKTLASKSFGESIDGAGILPVSGHVGHVESLKEPTGWQPGPLRPASLAAWAVRSAGMLLLSLGGLTMMSGLNYPPPLFINLPLLILFWINWVTLLVSLLCWICSRRFPVVSKSADGCTRLRR